MKKGLRSIRSHLRFAEAIWGQLSQSARRNLEQLIKRHGLSVAAGDLQYLDGRWYVTHAGLLRLSHRRRCLGIRTMIEKGLSDPVANRWIFKAVVYKSPGSKGFVGYGDADPSNTSPLVRGAEMRVAETRAVNRALRKAYGIGLCSVEELGSLTGASGPARENGKKSASSAQNGSGNGPPRLRDRLCLLIRQQQLDAALVKRYAAEFCGTENLRDAGRDQIEGFINHLAEWAAKDRAGLLCKLNGYQQPQEVAS